MPQRTSKILLVRLTANKNALLFQIRVTCFARYTVWFGVTRSDQNAVNDYFTNSTITYFNWFLKFEEWFNRKCFPIIKNFVYPVVALVQKNANPARFLHLYLWKKMYFSWRNLARFFQNKHFFKDNLARFTFSQRILKELKFQIRSIHGIIGSDL